MSTTKGSKRSKSNEDEAKDKLKQGQPEADPVSFGRKKLDRRFGKRGFTEADRAKWREDTKRMMKKSPRTTVRKELPEVLVAVLEEAHEGSCQHAKFLFEFAGADTLPDAKEVKKNQTLTELLLENLGAGKKQSKVGSRRSEEKS